MPGIAAPFPFLATCVHACNTIKLCLKWNDLITHQDLQSYYYQPWPTDIKDQLSCWETKLALSHEWCWHWWKLLTFNLSLSYIKGKYFYVKHNFYSLYKNTSYKKNSRDTNSSNVQDGWVHTLFIPLLQNIDYWYIYTQYSIASFTIMLSANLTIRFKIALQWPVVAPRSSKHVIRLCIFKLVDIHTVAGRKK